MPSASHGGAGAVLSALGSGDSSGDGDAVPRGKSLRWGCGDERVSATGEAGVEADAAPPNGRLMTTASMAARKLRAGLDGLHARRGVLSRCEGCVASH